MKILRPVLSVALLCCGAAGAAFAGNVHVVFDPTPMTPDEIISGNFGVVTDPTAIYSVTWESCTANGPAQAFGSSYQDSNSACLALVNETFTSLTQLNLSFQITQAVLNDGITGIDCQNVNGDPHLTSNTCGSIEGPFSLGQIVSAEFFSGDPIPNFSAFFIGEMGIPLADAPPVTITAPEPKALTLLAAGMGLIGLCMAFVKR